MHVLQGSLGQAQQRVSQLCLCPLLWHFGLRLGAGCDALPQTNANYDC